MAELPQDVVRVIEEVVFPASYSGGPKRVETETLGAVTINRRADSIDIELPTQSEETLRRMLGFATDQVDESSTASAHGFKVKHEDQDTITLTIARAVLTMEVI